MSTESAFLFSSWSDSGTSATHDKYCSISSSFMIVIFLSSKRISNPPRKVLSLIFLVVSHAGIRSILEISMIWLGTVGRIWRGIESGTEYFLYERKRVFSLWETETWDTLGRRYFPIVIIKGCSLSSIYVSFWGRDSFTRMGVYPFG